MAHRSWYYGDSFDSSFDDEVRQALKEQPDFMLKCSKIQGAKFVKEISKKDLPNITTDGFMYFVEEEQKFFILDKHCAYLLGIFDLQKTRIYQKEFDEIKEKSSKYIKYNDEFKNGLKTFNLTYNNQYIFENNIKLDVLGEIFKNKT